MPTPTAARKPNLEPLLTSARMVGGQLKPDDIVVFESTVYPGTIEEDCVPVMEWESGLVCGRDFNVATRRAGQPRRSAAPLRDNH